MLLHVGARPLYLVIGLLFVLIIGWSARSSSWTSETAALLNENYHSPSTSWHTSDDTIKGYVPKFSQDEDTTKEVVPEVSQADYDEFEVDEEYVDDDTLESDSSQSIDTSTNAPYGQSLPPTELKPTTSVDSSTIAHSGQSLPPGSSSAWDPNAYYVVQSSKLSRDKKWFPMKFLGQGSYNPNLIAHPWLPDTWYMIAQGSQMAGYTKASLHNVELVCEAAFIDNQIQCVRSQTSLAIAPSISDLCVEELEMMKKIIGPADARVFYGPDRPFITFGSPSQYTCFGWWMQDLRRLVTWNTFVWPDSTFFWPTELQRPPPYDRIEKNWFPFWDDVGDLYLHYDVSPRTFAKVNDNATSVSGNLASAKDNECIEEMTPDLQAGESIHQATNSLAVTMCLRSDPTCKRTTDNTFIFSIFHHKQYRGHNLYEPYVMMFSQTSPFGIHGISNKPFWINGRGKAGDGNPDRPADQSEMMYVTSISWKEQNMTYHGYLDDDLFINFGIEDVYSGTIDVQAAQLMREVALCE